MCWTVFDKLWGFSWRNRCLPIVRGGTSSIFYTKKPHTMCILQGSSHSLEDLKTRPSRKIHSLCSPRVLLGFDTWLNGLRKNKQGLPIVGSGFNRQETAVPTCLLRFYRRFLRSTQGSALTNAECALSEQVNQVWLCTLCVDQSERLQDTFFGYAFIGTWGFCSCAHT